MTRRGTPEQPSVFVGASIPRSGHHFLESVLKAYWGAELRYCAFYDEPGCCKLVPCAQRRGERVIYQKNHDWASSVPLGLDDVRYLVQYRHPVPAALSDWERTQRERLDPRGPDYRRSRAAHAWYLANKAWYFRRFHDKWLAAPVPGAILIEYDRFRADPAGVLDPVFAAADGATEAPRLAHALAATTGIQAASGEPYRPRVVAAASLPFPDLMIAFEAHLLAACPGFGYRRFFEGEGAMAEFRGVLMALDETIALPEGETDRLIVADRLSGGHPEVRLRLAERHLKQGRAAEALALAEELTAAQPGFAPGWGLLLRAARKLKVAPRLDGLGAEAAFGAVGHPEVLVQLGQLWLARGETLKAAGVLAMAAGLHPERPRVRSLWAQALAKLGRREQALAEAEEALRRDPEDRIAASLLRGREAGPGALPSQ
jgi:hypothetical protein